MPRLVLRVTIHNTRTHRPQGGDVHQWFSYMVGSRVDFTFTLTTHPRPLTHLRSCTSPSPASPQSLARLLAAGDVMAYDLFAPGQDRPLPRHAAWTWRACTIYIRAHLHTPKRRWIAASLVTTLALYLALGWMTRTDGSAHSPLALAAACPRADVRADATAGLHCHRRTHAHTAHKRARRRRTHTPAVRGKR